MTEVAFHFNVPDKWGYACRLVRKAVGRGVPVAVTGEADVLQRFDQELWRFSAVDFVPHCSSTDEAAMVDASPVVLCASPDDARHRQVLLNLGSAVPAGFDHFDRLIEIVGSDAQDRAASRQRWKLYAQRGHAIVRHDLAGAETH